MHIKVNAVFLVSVQRVSQKINKNQSYCIYNMQRSRSKINRKNAFWAKIRKKIKFFKPFGLDPPTSGHRTTSRVPLGTMKHFLEVSYSIIGDPNGLLSNISIPFPFSYNIRLH